MKYFAFLFCLFTFFILSVHSASAVEDPLSKPNNKVGIHILFPGELAQAAQLVNSNGGDWGYVTIPIQSGDKDLIKWQAFMDQAAKLHVIPIIRLATEGDYFNTQVWRKPDYDDVVDFANFLSSLTWPTSNRYIVVFNEVNRGDEWGGQPHPEEYANILSYAVTAFKTRSPDFFIISAGMDNAAANTNNAMNEYTFFQQMNQAIPGIFNQVDGLGSHSYPNPAFSVPPWISTNESITSYQFEKNFIKRFGTKDLPTFITETGWSQSAVGESTAADYLKTAFSSIWTDPQIAAVTPFLLQAGGGPFTQFSFYNSGGSQNKIYQALASLPKIKGQPTVTQTVLAATTLIEKELPTEKFPPPPIPHPIPVYISHGMKTVAKWLLKL